MIAHHYASMHRTGNSLISYQHKSRRHFQWTWLQVCQEPEWYATVSTFACPKPQTQQQPPGRWGGIHPIQGLGICLFCVLDDSCFLHQRLERSYERADLWRSHHNGDPRPRHRWESNYHPWRRWPCSWYSRSASLKRIDLLSDFLYSSQTPEIINRMQ